MDAPAPTRPVPTPIQKACPVVLRDGGGRLELLAFAHPERGVELVKGIIGPHESPEDAALRELREESGLKGRRAPGEVCRIEPVRGERWHLVPCAAPGAPDQWIHRAPRQDGGHLFRFRWLPVEGPLPAGMSAAHRAVIAEFARFGV